MDELHPTWFVFENVSGLTSMNHGETQKMIEKCFENLGYTVSPAVLWASDYGVPQHRNRFFLIGNAYGVKFEFPEKHEKQISVEEAIGDLPILVNGQMDDVLPYRKTLCEIGKYAKMMRNGSENATQNYVSKNAEYVLERYKYISQGQNWKAIPVELMGNYANRNNCHSGIYKRLVADKPSVVISNYRKNMLIHPFQDRGLSVREAARLQSFPDTFLFKGSIMHIQQQIGNAVPPLLAKAVFDKILKYE